MLLYFRRLQDASVSDVGTYAVRLLGLAAFSLV